MDIKPIVFIIVILVLVSVFAFHLMSAQPEEANEINIINYAEEDNTEVTEMDGAGKVRLTTSMGDIIIELSADMPITAGNFRKLVEEGYYNGVIFHRIIDGFMIQGGDPTGTGMGGPGYTIPDEFTDHNKNDRGTLSMANAGANTGGSQFFINLVNNSFLDAKHPVFGKVVEGMDIVDKIAKVPTDENDKPLEAVKIVKAEIIQ